MNDERNHTDLPPDPLAGITPEEWQRLMDETEAEEDAERERINRLGASFYRRRKEGPAHKDEAENI